MLMTCISAALTSAPSIVAELTPITLACGSTVAALMSAPSVVAEDTETIKLIVAALTSSPSVVLDDNPTMGERIDAAISAPSVVALDAAAVGPIVAELVSAPSVVADEIRTSNLIVAALMSAPSVVAEVAPTKTEICVVWVLSQFEPFQLTASHPFNGTTSAPSVVAELMDMPPLSAALIRNIAPFVSTAPFCLK